MEKSIKNRKVKFEYEFIEVYTAGIKLTGLEVKAFRESKFNISDTYCYFHRGELFIKGAIIVGENVDLKLLLKKLARFHYLTCHWLYFSPLYKTH